METAEVVARSQSESKTWEISENAESTWTEIGTELLWINLMAVNFLATTTFPSCKHEFIYMCVTMNEHQ